MLDSKYEEELMQSIENGEWIKDDDANKEMELAKIAAHRFMQKNNMLI